MGIFFDRDFEDELSALRADSDRLDDALRGVEFQLSESPASGIETVVPGIYVVPIRLPSTAGQLIRMSLYYTYDGKDVTFRMLRRGP